MSVVSSVHTPLEGGWSMHSLHGGSLGRPARRVVLVHGADRHFQNAAHWTAHFDWLAQRSLFWAVDLPGHGSSVPGPDADAAPSEPQRVAALCRLLEGDANGCVLVGRSLGGRIAAEAAQRCPKAVRAFVFVAPAITNPRELSEEVLQKPALFFWAEDDPVVPFSRSQEIVSCFHNARLVSLGKVLNSSNAHEAWRAHCPENERRELFHQEIDAFLKTLHD
eukprot:m51a1_g11336 hypothetical protein (221) ;mRNA; f:146942-147885